MPRCCVSGCNSGTFKDVKTCYARGVRGKSFFRFPKKPELLQKWKEIIFQNEEKVIDDRYRICELHFNDSDIVKYYETLLKDGTVHRIQRARYIIRNDAIPHLLNKEEKAKDSTQIAENILGTNEILTHDNIVANNQEENENNQNFEEISTSDNEADIIHSKSVKISTKIHNANESENSTETILKNPVVFKNYEKKKTSVQSQNYIGQNDQILLYQSKQNNTQINKETVDFQNKEVTTQTNDETLSMRVTNENKNCEQDYDFNHLKNDLQSKTLNISTCWSYAFREDRFTFAYVHPLKLVIQLFCIIDSGMNVKLITFDKRVTMDVNIKLKSRKEVIDYLSKLEKTKCCEGTGVKNIYSKKCQGFIPPSEEYKRSRGYQRCGSCRKFRTIIIRKEDDPLDTELRLKEQNRKIKALKYKCAELEKLLSEKQGNSSKK